MSLFKDKSNQSINQSQQFKVPPTELNGST